MSVLILGPNERQQIEAAKARAGKNPVRWEKMKEAAISDRRKDLALADRKPGFERPPSEHMVFGNVRIAYSVEEQPAGIFRHLSASVERKGFLPDLHVMQALCEAFGFGAFPPAVGHVWTEEFDPGHHAVNVIELITPEAGHA
jgi:hypothetical protein